MEDKQESPQNGKPDYERLYKELMAQRIAEEARHIEETQSREELKKAFYDKKNTFLATRFADWLTQVHPEYKFVTPTNDLGGDVIWMYHEDLGIYLPDGVTVVEQNVKGILDEDTQTGYYSDVVKHLKVNTYMDPHEFTDDPALIVLQNGTFNVATRELLPHSPIYRAKTRIPVTYDERADCPTVKAFLQRVAPENLVFLQEWVGYHLLKDYRFQRCVVLVGEGDNGKSTFLGLLTSFLGPENVTGQSLFRLSTNRFAPAELQGRLANVAADIGPDELKNTGTIKMLTGGDWITAEKKNRDPFKFLNYAKMSFSCNQLPKTPDETLAFFKRFIVVLFDQTIPKEEQDPQLLSKMTTKEELSGLLNWALVGLTRLLEQGGFTEAGTAMERKELYKRMSDPVTGFVNDCIIIESEATEEKQIILNAFAGYCKAHGFVPVSDKKFVEEFRKQVYCRETQIKVGDRRPRVFQGVKLTGKPSLITGITGITGLSTSVLENYSSGEPDRKPCDPRDPCDGQKECPINIPVGNTGSEPEERSLRKDLSTLLTFLGEAEKQEAGAVDVNQLYGIISFKRKWTREAFDKILGVAMKDGTVYQPRPGYYRRTTP